MSLSVAASGSNSANADADAAVPTVSVLELTQLKNSIETLGKNHHIEITKILLENSINFSENKNGIFLNLSTLTYEQITELQNYISYVNDQETTLNEFETMKTNYTKTFFQPDTNSNTYLNNINLINNTGLEQAEHNETDDSDPPAPPERSQPYVAAEGAAAAAAAAP